MPSTPPRTANDDNNQLIPTSNPALGSSTYHMHRQSAPGGFGHHHILPQQQQPQHMFPPAEPHYPNPVPDYAHRLPPANPSSAPHSPQPASPHSHDGLFRDYPSRDQRPGSFPLVSVYHSQRQASYGLSAIPSSHPYSTNSPPPGLGASSANGGVAPAGAHPPGLPSKLRAAESHRRHTASELPVAPVNASFYGRPHGPATPYSGGAATSSFMASSAITPPETVVGSNSSRHNSCASSNSSSTSSTLVNEHRSSPVLPPINASAPFHGTTLNKAMMPSPVNAPTYSKSRHSSNVQALLNPADDDEDDDDDEMMDSHENDETVSNNGETMSNNGETASNNDGSTSRGGHTSSPKRPLESVPLPATNSAGSAISMLSVGSDRANTTSVVGSTFDTTNSSSSAGSNSSNTTSGLVGSVAAAVSSACNSPRVTGSHPMLPSLSALSPGLSSTLSPRLGSLEEPKRKRVRVL